MTEQDSDLSEEMIVSGQLNSEGAPGRILFEKLHELENFLTHYGRAANSEESRMKLKNDKEKLESLGCLLPEDEVGLKTIINDATLTNLYKASILIYCNDRGDTRIEEFVTSYVK